MKRLTFILVLIFSGFLVNAQEIFFPTREGTTLVYKTFDKKDKVSGTMKYTIKHLTINGNDMDITYLAESLDAKDKLIFKEEITIQQKGDKLYFDMSNLINKAAFQQEGEMPAEIEVTGNNMEVPANPNPGDVLPDANVEMSMKMGFVNMKMSANVTNRKVEAIEDVTVTAGSYKGYKFSYAVNSNALGIKVNSTGIDWYAKGVGIIKSESYDNKGNLISRTELIELK
jgi:hypothetical protein